MTTNDYKLTSLYHNTDIILDKALELFRFKRDYNNYYDGSPRDYAMVVAEYQAAQELLEELIIDDMFVDLKALDLVLGAVKHYRDALSDNFPLTTKLVSQYVSEVEAHREARFSN